MTHNIYTEIQTQYKFICETPDIEENKVFVFARDPTAL